MIFVRRGIAAIRDSVDKFTQGGTHANGRLSGHRAGEHLLTVPDHALFVLIVHDLSWASQRSPFL